MASGNETITDNTNCPVCMEDYDVNEHIPRIFPCFDTFCQRCIKELLRQGQNELTCPQCRAVHKTLNKGFQAFQQNRYIVATLQNAKTNEKRKNLSQGPHFKQCKMHMRKQTLFCKQNSCMRAICVKCLTQDHRLHDVQDIEEQHELYAECVKKTIENIAEKKNNLLKAKDDMTKYFKATHIDIERTKREIIKIVNTKFDKLKRDCDAMKVNNDQNLQRKIDFLNDKTIMLGDLEKESIAHSGEMYDFDLINGIQKSVGQDFDIINVEYKQYKKPEVWKQMASDICGKLTCNKRTANTSNSPRDGRLQSVSFFMDGSY